MDFGEHELKCWPEQFDAIWDGSKTAEFRKDDRRFAVGDVLVLREWDRRVKNGNGFGRYTGRQVRRRITHIVRGPDFDIPSGYVMLSLDQGEPTHGP